MLNKLWSKVKQKNFVRRIKKNIAGTILEATRIVKASQKTVIPADAITFKIEASTL